MVTLARTTSSHNIPPTTDTVMDEEEEPVDPYARTKAEFQSKFARLWLVRPENHTATRHNPLLQKNAPSRPDFLAMFNLVYQYKGRLPPGKVSLLNNAVRCLSSADEIEDFRTARKLADLHLILNPQDASYSCFICAFAHFACDELLPCDAVLTKIRNPRDHIKSLLKDHRIGSTCKTVQLLHLFDKHIGKLKKTKQLKKIPPKQTLDRSIYPIYA